MEKNMEDNISGGRQNRKRETIDFLRDAFADTDILFPIDEEKKTDALMTLQKEITHKKTAFVNDKGKIWKNQLRYADRTTLILHIAGCILMLFTLKLMNIQNIDRGMMLTIATVLSGMLGSLSILAVGKSCFAKLSELSESCFFNVRQLAAFDLVLSGVMNLAVLTVCILFMCFRWQINLIRIGLYILVPFVFTQCTCLGVLLTERGRRNMWLNTAAGIFLSVSCAVSTSISSLYTQAALIFWGIGFVLGTVILILQIKTLFTEINKGEILCTNWN